MAKGVSIVNANSFNLGTKGISVVSDETPLRNYGVSIASNNNIYVIVCDPSNNPVSAQIDITGGSDVDGVYSGFDEYAFTSGTFTDINFEASASGYITNDTTVDVFEGGYVVVKIELIPDTVAFTCTTTFKNQFGTTISKPLLDGYVEVKFEGSAVFNKDDFLITFEAIKQASSKYASIVLDYELIDEQADSLTYKVGVVQEAGDYCYLSNISKKLC